MDDIFDMLMQEIEQGAVPLFFRAGGVPPKPAERIRALSMAGGAFGRQGKSPFGAGPCGGRVYGYLGAGGYDASCPCCGHPPDPSVLKQKRPCPQMETKAVEKPLRYHSNSVKTHREQAKRDNTALVRAVTGTPGGAYWRKALGPRLPGDLRRVRPAALAPKGRLSERQPFRLLVLFKALRYSARPTEADAIYIIGARGICQPFSREKFHKKRSPPVPRRRWPPRQGRPAAQARVVDPARLSVSRYRRQRK